MWVRMRTFVWPRRSFWRSAQYYAKRVLRLTASPHSIAAGVGAGVFASFTPFLGFHIMMAAAIAWLIRGNIVASAVGTVLANPITLPFMWGGSFEIGKFILDGSRSGQITPLHIGSTLAHMHIAELWGPILKPLTVGSVPLGLVFGLLFYGLVRWAVMGFREERRRRLAERARRRAAAAAQRYSADAAAG